MIPQATGVEDEYEDEPESERQSRVDVPWPRELELEHGTTYEGQD